MSGVSQNPRPDVEKLHPSGTEAVADSPPS
jgi:hypothetical protein